MTPKTPEQLLKEATTYTVTGYGKIPLDWVREALASVVLEAAGKLPEEVMPCTDMKCGGCDAGESAIERNRGTERCRSALLAFAKEIEEGNV